MRLVKLLGTTVVGIAAATALVASLPILGAVGAVSSTGAVIAAAVGTGAAIFDQIKDNEEK